MVNPSSVLNITQQWIVRNYLSLQKYLIIFGVLVLSFVLPLQLPSSRLIYIIGLVVGIGAIFVLMRWPALGFLGLIGTIIVPVNGPSGLTPTMVLLALLIGLWLLDTIIYRREFDLGTSVTLWPILVFMFSAFLSLGIGQIPWYTFAEQAPLGAQLGSWALFILSPALMLLAGYQIKEISWLKRVTWAFLLIGALFIILQLTNQRDIGRRLFVHGSTESLFWTWLAVLTFSQAILNKKLPLYWRIALGSLCIATLYLGIGPGNHWKSGWIPPLVAVIATVGFMYWRLTLSIAPFVVVPILSVITYLIATDEYSWGTRVDAWLIVLEISKANPILGLGFGNYRWYTPLFPIRGWAVQFNSHSQYVDLYAQTGLIGLVCFVWLFATIFWLAWRLKDRVPAGFCKAYVYGALGGWVGTVVAGALGDWVLPFFYNVGLKGFRSSMLAWLFLGGLLVLENKYKNKEEIIE